jgi:hypothetical protein
MGRIRVRHAGHYNMAKITAEKMAMEAGVDARVFRQALRDQKFPWHVQWEHWAVEVGSEQHRAMEGVLTELCRSSKGR